VIAFVPGTQATGECGRSPEEERARLSFDSIVIVKFRNDYAHG